MGEKAAVDAEIAAELKENRYDPVSGTLRFTPGQAAAWNATVAYYNHKFGAADDAESLRKGALLPASEGGDDAAKSSTRSESYPHSSPGRRGCP